MPACTSMLTRLCAVGLDGCSLMTPAQSPHLLLFVIVANYLLQPGYSDLCEECCNCIIAREKRVLLLSISRSNYEGATQQQRGALMSSPKVKNTHFFLLLCRQAYCSPHRSRLKKDMPTTYPRPQRHAVQACEKEKGE